MALKSSVKPVRVYLPSADLHTTVARGVGFRAVASDGWKGPSRRTYADARKDAREHKTENAAPLVREDVTPAKGKAV